MGRHKQFKPYTHEELGLPQYIDIAGFRVTINFDSSISDAVVNPDVNGRQLNPIWKTGVIGRADFSNQRIDLWTGNKLYKPTKQRMLFTLLEEIEHFIFYCMQLQPKNLEQNVWLHANEHVVVSHTTLLYQVLKQLKGVDFSN